MLFSAVLSLLPVEYWALVAIETDEFGSLAEKEAEGNGLFIYLPMRNSGSGMQCLAIDCLSRQSETRTANGETSLAYQLSSIATETFLRVGKVSEPTSRATSTKIT